MEENKESFQKIPCDQYRGLSEEEKNKKGKYARNWYQNVKKVNKK